MVPVDIDVTPMDNSKTAKQGVSRTYKGFDGYAPMMAYIGTEGYAVNFELREGKQHCQNGTVEFLLETINLCRKLTDKPLLVRLDSGNDYIDNVAVLIDTGCSFIIKRNLRKESREEWFQMAKTYCKDITTPREGKTVYIGSDWKEVESKRFEKDFTLRTGYEILVKIANEKDTEIREQEKEIEDKANKKDTEKREFNWKPVGGISFAVVAVAGISAGVLGGKFGFKLPKK